MRDGDASAPRDLDPSGERTVVAVAVVIPTRDRAGSLRRALGSVLRGDVLPAEIVVVDQSAAPPGLRVDDRLPPSVGLRHLITPVPGVSRARNLGVSVSRAPVIAFIDDDVVVDREWLGRAVAALEAAGPRAVVCGRVRDGTAATGGTGHVASVVDSDVPVVHTAVVDRDVLYSGNCAVPRSVLAEVGPFDERLGPGTRWPAAEDNDMARRMLRRGIPIHYVPGMGVAHHGVHTTRSFARLNWRYGVGHGAFLAKHALAGDREASRRALREAAVRAREALAYARRRDPWSVIPAAHAAGILAGFVGWALLRPPPRRRPGAGFPA